MKRTIMNGKQVKAAICRAFPLRGAPWIFAGFVWLLPYAAFWGENHNQIRLALLLSVYGVLVAYDIILVRKNHQQFMHTFSINWQLVGAIAALLVEGMIRSLEWRYVASYSAVLLGVIVWSVFWLRRGDQDEEET